MSLESRFTYMRSAIELDFVLVSRKKASVGPFLTFTEGVKKHRNQRYMTVLLLESNRQNHTLQFKDSFYGWLVLFESFAKIFT